MATQYEKDLQHSADDFTLSPDEWQAYAACGTERVREIVRDNAGRSILIALGAGLGVGLMIGSALGSSNQSSRWWDRSTAEGLGRRLLDKVEGLVPNNLSDRFNG